MARKTKWRNAWFVSALWVCLMSGIASIFREVLILFFPTFAPPSQIFQSCSVSCFVVSGFVVIYRLQERVYELENRSPSEERYVQMVKDAITHHGDQVATLLRHLKLMGATVFEAGTVPSLPDGMDHSQTLKLLKALKAENIVYDESIPYDLTSPLARMMAPGIWRIAPGIEPILDETLYP
jgi:uncharacterized coiled-coil protein SlyX